MTEVRDSLREFCQVELGLNDAASAYKDACASSYSSRTRAYDMLTRAMADGAHTWMSLPSGGYLRHNTTNTQKTLKEEMVREAMRATLSSFRDNAGRTIDDARKNLLSLMKTEIRNVRTTPLVTVTYVEKLPRSMDNDKDSIPVADAYVVETSKAWMHAKRSIASAREAHRCAVEPLQKQRQSVLDTTGVCGYLKNMSGGGQPVSLAGHADKMTLRHSVSSRRKPVREAHVQEAIAYTVATALADENAVLSVDGLTELVMTEMLRLAGSETKDVFSLVAQRGRKRGAATD